MEEEPGFDRRARFEPTRQTTDDFTQALADPDVFVGGGAAGAMALASAAATTLLVVRLSTKRKANRPILDKIADAETALDELRMRFLSGITNDVHALEQLISAQRATRAARRTGTNEPEAAAALATATIGAIDAPIEIASNGCELLSIIKTAMPWAASFTASDLGAAAALANGGIQALLLMAEINLTSSAIRDSERDRYKQSIDELRNSSSKESLHVINETRRIVGVSEEKGT